MENNWNDMEEVKAKPFTKWGYTLLKADVGFILGMFGNDYENPKYKRYEKIYKYVVERRKLSKDA